MKKYWRKSYNWIKKNQNLIILESIIIIISLLYIDIITDLSVKLSINYIYFTQHSLFFEVIFWISVIIILFRFSWLYSINYIFSKKWIFWIIYFSIIYISVRFNHHQKINFISLSSNKNLFFTDSILLVFFLTIINYSSIIKNIFKNLWNKVKLNFEEKETEIKQFTYQEDNPLSGKEEIFNEKLTHVIFQNIQHFKPQQAFIIAINSEWGKGKTSALKRIQYKISLMEEYKPITFWFNSWQIEKENITKLFFNQLTVELSKYNGNANTQINNYLNKIISIESNSLTKGFKVIKDIFFNSHSIIEDFNTVNDIIEKTKKKIIVFIDDLDRLNKDEIKEALKLLRNIANFKNIVFICGVDKNYLIRKGELEPDYLDKVFNLEINLALKERNYFLNELINLIKETDTKILNDDNKKNICNTLYSNKPNSKSIFTEEVILSDINLAISQPSKNNLLNPTYFFESIRDINRFYNQLITNLQIFQESNEFELNIDKEINIKDYLLFQLLIFKHSWAYNLFNKKNTDQWLTVNQAKNITFKETDEFNDILDNQNISNLDKNSIKLILKTIFSEHVTQTHRRIKEKRYLPFYINNNVFSESISYNNLIKHFESNTIEKLINSIKNNSHVTNLIDDIKKFLIENHNLDKIDHFKQIISLVNKSIIKFDHYGLIKIIYQLDQNLDENENFKLLNNSIFIELTEKENSFGKLLLYLNLFYSSAEGNEPVLRDYSALKNLRYVTKDYVKNKIIELFKLHLKSKDSNLNNILNILNYCTEQYFNIVIFSTYYPEVINLFKEYLSKNSNYSISNLSTKNHETLSYIFNNDNSLLKKAQEENKKNDEIKFNKGKEFIKLGLENFLAYITKNSNHLNQTEMEKFKKDIDSYY